MAVSSDPPGTVSVTDDRDIYGGAVVDDATTWRMFGVAPSTSSVWHNVLSQSAGNRPASFTLTFAQPVLAVRFLRAALIAGPTGVTHPEWTATAVGSEGNVIARVHENQIASYSPVPPRSYDLIGSEPITSVTFAGDNHAFAAFTNLVLQLIGWCR
ncbi:MAG TPA: hypothetical protein VFE16_03595 [Candidatus Cybelea sp.]|nr:hypothetical protein [Candidatus Cybelea sp.]